MIVECAETRLGVAESAPKISRRCRVMRVAPSCSPSESLFLRMFCQWCGGHARPRNTCLRRVVIDPFLAEYVCASVQCRGAPWSGVRGQPREALEGHFLVMLLQEIVHERTTHVQGEHIRTTYIIYRCNRVVKCDKTTSNVCVGGDTRATVPIPAH